MAALVELEGVSVRFGPTVALDGVTLAFDRGLHVILGPNGSGKTTLLRVVAGLLRPTSGRVRVGGVDLTARRLPARPPVAGLVGDEEPPFWMTGREYLEYAASIGGCLGGCWSGLVEAARLLSLERYLDMPVPGLSTGTRKKLVLLAALARSAPVLVADEPFSGLDRGSVDIVSSMLARESRSRAVLVATHILPPSLDSPSTLTLLVNGRVAAHVDTGRIETVEAPVVRARLRDPTPETLAAALRLAGARRVELERGAAWALLDGPSFAECVERGICTGEYTVSPSGLGWGAS
ncbi:MAG: ABC transporter ATP-binding protein [Desulfurococcales archaeon]|nr:ABC transporter ATP-binding protein [Desulfurococcales archaeon]